MGVNMELRPLGTSDIKISPIIMGTWQAGKAMWVGIKDNESIKAIKAAYDAGITTFDTAEVYGNGHSEKIVGNALHDVRGRVVIASKVFSNHLKYEQVIWTPRKDGTWEVRIGTTERGCKSSALGNLKELRTKEYEKNIPK